MAGQQDQAEQLDGKGIFADPLGSEPTIPVPVHQRDTEWELPNGFAWIYYGEGRSEITNPILMADGFNNGRSDLQWLAQGLDGNYKFLTNLRQQGRTVILIGFNNRTASILDNAKTVRAAIEQTIAARPGREPLTVGGFSMGGLITRFALTQMEREDRDHETALYFSYDTPHRGAVIPIALQAFAHFIPTANEFADQMNSTAARQMLWRHYNSETGAIEIDPERAKLLMQLRDIGTWPQRPMKIGVANGTGDGKGVAVPPGKLALKSTGLIGFPGSVFNTQAQGEKVLVADLKRLLPPAAKKVTTDGLPELDGAPGGTLDSYQIVADALVEKGGKVDLKYPTVCFVPTVSAVAIRDLDKQADLYAKVDDLDPQESELDEFMCSSTTTPHTAITEELCTWIMDRLPN